eukprot:225753-Hanusia_phi.AAC.3
MAEALILALREKHAKLQHAGSERGAKTTLGIILEGTRVSMVVPASPAYRPRRGRRVEREDEVVEVDGVGVRKEAVLKQLRGCDEIGSVVKVKFRRGQSEQVEEVTLVRACMEQVVELKELFLAMAELKANAERKSPDMNENIRLIAVVEKQLAKIDAVREDTENRLRSSEAHVSDLEASLRETTESLQEALRQAEDNYKQQLSMNAKLSEEIGRLKETSQEKLDLVKAENENLKHEIIQLQALVDQLSDGLQQRSELQDSFIHMQDQVCEAFQQIDDETSRIEDVLLQAEETFSLLSREVENLIEHAIDCRLQREEQLRRMTADFRDAKEKLRLAEVSIQNKEEETAKLQHTMVAQLQLNLGAWIEHLSITMMDVDLLLKETKASDSQAARTRLQAEQLMAELARERQARGEVERQLEESRSALERTRCEGDRKQQKLESELTLREEHAKQSQCALEEQQTAMRQLVAQHGIEMQRMERAMLECKNTTEEVEELQRLRGIERKEYNYLKAEYHRWFKELKKCKSDITNICSEINKLVEDTAKDKQWSDSVVQQQSNMSLKMKFLEKKIFNLEEEKKKRDAQRSYSDEVGVLKIALDASTEALEECHSEQKRRARSSLTVAVRVKHCSLQRVANLQVKSECELTASQYEWLTCCVAPRHKPEPVKVEQRVLVQTARATDVTWRGRG